MVLTSYNPNYIEDRSRRQLRPQVYLADVLKFQCCVAQRIVLFRIKRRAETIACRSVSTMDREACPQ